MAPSPTHCHVVRVMQRCSCSTLGPALGSPSSRVCCDVACSENPPCALALKQSMAIALKWCYGALTKRQLTGFWNGFYALTEWGAQQRQCMLYHGFMSASSSTPNLPVATACPSPAVSEQDVWHRLTIPAACIREVLFNGKGLYGFLPTPDFAISAVGYREVCAHGKAAACFSVENTVISLQWVCENLLGYHCY